MITKENVFINLRNYSENSILNAPIKIDDLIKKAKENNYPAVALTDKNAYGMVKFWSACKNENVKPLFWLNSKTQWNLHNFLLFAKSEQWQKNMFKLSTDFITEKTTSISNYKKENQELLKDVIFIVDYSSWEQFPLYQEIFDSWIIEKENIYIEIQPKHNEEQYKKAIELVWINNVIITSPVLYLEPEDKESLLLMKAIEKSGSLSDIDASLYDWFHFKTEEEIKKELSFIPETDFEQIKTNIHNIVNNIYFDLDTSYKIPFFNIDGELLEAYNKFHHITDKVMKSDEFWLRWLAYSRLGFRYWKVDEKFNLSYEEIFMMVNKDHKLELEKPLKEYSIPEIKEMSKSDWTKEKQEWYNQLSDKSKEYIDRIEYELMVMHHMWFDSYLLIVWDYINWSRDNGDLVGPWRGSAAGSIVTFLTWITDIDPIRWDLLFERFINSSRVNMPDVDTDFSNRDNVIQHCIDLYWQDRVTPIITFWKLTSRTVLKGVWKAYNVNFNLMNRVTKLITNKEATWHVPLEKILEENDDFRNKIESSTELKQVYQKSLKLEWFKQQTWTHACAVIIAPKPTTEYMPLQYPQDKKGNVDKTAGLVTQLEGPDAEAIGLLKMDFLWLKNLTIINDCLRIVKRHKNTEEDMTNVDVEIQEVYENIFHTWRTTNVFQFESSWMKKYMKQLKPNNLNDLIAMVSLYRPWPLEFIPSFINRKHGLEPIEYMSNELRKQLTELGHTDEEIEKQKELLEEKLKWILDVSYGIAVYQEQLMAMAQSMAWFSLWEADLLRRAIWKKKKKIIMEQREIFIKKAEQFWFYPETTGYIYDKTIIPAANYSFNKCLTWDTKILLVNWEYKTINELRKTKFKNLKLKSLNTKKNTFEVDKIVDIHENGIKDVYEITLKNWLTIKSTDNHQFYTIDWWKELKEIGVWWKIAIPNNSKIDKDISFEEIKNIKYIWKEETFDLEIEKNHNFIANWIITHNSHAACYAFIAYQGAYLKNKYPAEYTTAILMTQGEELPRVLVAIEDAFLDGIYVEPLDINKSNVEYEYIDDTHIKMWLKTIKGVWVKSLEKIIEEREKNGKYEDFDDFVIRNKTNLDSKVLTWLLKSGALDNLIEQEKWLFNVKRILDFIKKAKKEKIHSQQVNLFDLFTEETPESKIVELEEPLRIATPYSKAQNELEVLWLMLKNHPFDHVKTFIEKLEYNRELLHFNKSLHYYPKFGENIKTIRWLAIIDDIFVNKTKDGKNILSLKLLWTDYYISAKIKESLYHKYEAVLVGTDKKNPIWIGKLLEYKGKYNVYLWNRSISIEEIEIKDIDKMYQVAKNKNMYNEKEKCNWEDIYKYKNTKIDDKVPIVLTVKDYLLEEQNRTKLKEKLWRIKSFLLKNNNLENTFHVIIKNEKWKILHDTKMYIWTKELKSFYLLIKREGWIISNISYNQKDWEYRVYDR